MVPALVVALATALRLAWVLLVPTKPVGDFAMYLESAAHLVAHGALDPEFVYMPGYVLLLALVQALGGGVLAAKLLAVALGGLGAAAVFGIADRLWSRRAAVAAGLLYAVWPAGIAVTSVTGTDLPTAVIVACAGWCLVRWGEARPVRAAVLFGLLMGLAAWMRAVALPLAALAVGYFRARDGASSWRQAARHTAVACAAAGLVLLPWVVRNRLRYGEVFVTDSHGGLTALVGANPNTDGAYSRSLNRLFFETTGYRLLAEPHRAADRTSYDMARAWTRFEPAYAVGLVALKATRLLGSEAPLLYWPLFRQGVLPAGLARWFDGHRALLQGIVDAFWYVLVGAATFGLGLAIARRRWVALSFVPLQLGLMAIYALFFAEARYQLPIVMFLFPPAGAAVEWLVGTLARQRLTGGWREPLAGGACAALVLLGGPALAWGGGRLREGHRWAVHVCQIDGRARTCAWRRAHREGDSGIRGVWNGVGVAPGSSARLALELPPGRKRVTALLDLAPVGAGAGVVALGAGAVVVETALEHLRAESVAGRVVPVVLEVAHAGGTLALSLAAPTGSARVWLSDLRIEAVP